MTKNIKNKLTLVSNKKNKGLEPRTVGKITIGYSPEIHGDDSREYNFRLPIGAIKRVIHSYLEDKRDFDSEWVYFSQVGSSGMRENQYAERVLNDIEEQLNKHGLKGRKIVKEVFNLHFKKEYQKMKKFHKKYPDGYPPFWEETGDVG